MERIAYEERSLNPDFSCPPLAGEEKSVSSESAAYL